MSSTTQLVTAANTLVVVPALNEESSLASVIAEIKSCGYQVLVINDGSTDNTVDVARASGARILDLPINLGVGGALRAGFKYACERNFLAVVQVDADGQHPADEIVHLLDEANASGAHLVIGSRFLSAGTSMEVGTVRRFVMRLLARSASNATQSPITDATSGFRIIQQPLLTEFSRTFAVNYLGDTYEALIAAGRAGYVVREIPAALKPRLNGESTASLVQAVTFTLKGLAVTALHIHPRIRTFSKP
jgi:glycosyltransferase involved in cell wall biosynthesis